MLIYISRFAIAVISIIIVVGIHHGGPAAAGTLTGQVYYCSTFGMTPQEMADAGVTVVIHFHWSLQSGETKDWVERCHRLGILVLPYISPEKAWDDFDSMQSHNPAGSIPYYRAARPSHDRDWVLIGRYGRDVIRYGHWLPDSAGRLRPVWATGRPNTGSWYMSPQVKTYVDAVIQGVNDTLDIGVDGLFVDNVASGRYDAVSEDFGPRFGRRRYLHPGKHIGYAYVELIKRIADAIRGHKGGKIVLMNGGTEQVFAPHRDGCMLESFIYSGGPQIHPWPTIAGWQRQFADEGVQGRVVTVLPYIGNGHDRPGRDDAFFAFAAAKYCDFLYGHVGRLGRPMIRLRIGREIGPAQDEDDVAHRLCQAGTVAVNHGQRDRRVSLPAPPGVERICDFYRSMTLPVEEGMFVTDLPAGMGQVFVPAPVALDSYLGECVFYLHLRFTPDNDRMKSQTLAGLEQEIARIRQRLKAGLELRAVRDAVLALDLPVEAEPSWRLAQAASLVSGVEVRVLAAETPLIQGGVAPVKVVVRNTSASPVTIRFKIPEAPEGFKVTVPTQSTTIRARDNYEAAVTIEITPSAERSGERSFVQYRLPVDCKQGESRFRLMALATSKLAAALDISVPVPVVCPLEDHRRPLTVRITNRTAESIRGSLRASMPKGWRVRPLSLTIGPKRGDDFLLEVLPPPDTTNQLSEATVLF